MSSIPGTPDLEIVIRRLLAYSLVPAKSFAGLTAHEKEIVGDQATFEKLMKLALPDGREE